VYWVTFHIIFFSLPIEFLSCQRKAINNNEQEQDHAGAAPSTSPRSGGPAVSSPWVPAAHGTLVQGLGAAITELPQALHQSSGAGETVPMEFCFAERYWDPAGNSLGWFRAIVSIDEACILDDQYKISLLFSPYAVISFFIRFVMPFFFFFSKSSTLLICILIISSFLVVVTVGLVGGDFCCFFCCGLWFLFFSFFFKLLCFKPALPV